MTVKHAEAYKRRCEDGGEFSRSNHQTGGWRASAWNHQVFVLLMCCPLSAMSRSPIGRRPGSGLGRAARKKNY